MSLRRTFAEIDITALESNYRLLEKHFPGGFICPMVKANGYGHGLEVASHLEKFGAQRMGVGLIEEGIALRGRGVTAELIVFSNFDAAGVKALNEYNISPAVSSWESLHALDRVSSPLFVHVEFNTGMARLGFELNEAVKVSEALRENPLLKLGGVFTHLFAGEDASEENGHSARQLRALNEIVKAFASHGQFHVHALNSAGALHRIGGTGSSVLRERAWGVRPGLMIYGINGVPGSNVKLAPVMTIKAQVAMFRSVAKGQTISYNGTWRAEKDSVIAVIAAGYGDGYHRLLSNRSHALFEGERVPVIGTICMDYLMLDVTAQATAGKLDLNSEVILMGRSKKGGEISAAELAQAAQTIPWEICTSVGERIPRVTLGRAG